MTRGRIQNLNRWTNAAQRKAFEAPVFSTPTGATEIGGLRWGDEVDIVERRERRTRVRADGGVDGWVRNGGVVELRWIRRRGKAYTAPLYRESAGGAKRLDLLWGDPVLVLTPGEDRCRVWARGWTGYVDESFLGKTPLLELYFIDVGQGDGVLMRLPDGRHLLIDGGYTRAKQPTGKSAADFVDWKFFKDYGLADVRLDAVIASHCDADHYGGLWDLLRVDEEAGAELDCEDVEIGAFFHAGVSWWRPGDRWLGREKDGLLIDLLDGVDSVSAALQPDADRRLQGEWAGFLDDVRRATSNIHRLGVLSGDGGEVLVPEFATADGDVRIRVLAPVLHAVDGHNGVRSLGPASQNTNGHSVLLRVDFGASRILLTGDLNRKSMRLLLDEYEGREGVFACDVAKGCHHGSDDVSFAFLRHVNAAATVISSGDNEGHGHPRPAIVAASGAAGHMS
ncbi:MAG: ComEC/Rec2 family competence protein, partial [Thermoanaerobaculia bacterium]